MYHHIERNWQVMLQTSYTDNLIKDVYGHLNDTTTVTCLSVLQILNTVVPKDETSFGVFSFSSYFILMVKIGLYIHI